jgi:hypothetical protein
VKNYTKYGPTGILWALYVIVGVVAFLVSNLYFKFELKDAIIFGVVNLVAVIGITEGIDLIFKKVRLRQERKDDEATAVDDAESEKGSDKADVPENAPDKAPSDESIDSSEESAVEDLPTITGQPGGGKGRSWFKRNVKPSLDTNDSENKETTVEPSVTDESLNEEDVKETVDESPILITGAPGSGKNFHLLEQAVALRNAESIDAEAKDASADEGYKPRGRRVNPDAVIDAPTSSFPVITPDMIKPTFTSVGESPVVEPVEEAPVAEPVVALEAAPIAPDIESPAVEESVAEETYLSADEFLSTTKLTSPRAIVREYQRLGGKDDIYSILMERQK